jgi:hypothetical protein
MSVTRAQLVANTREMMDAASSGRWTDAFIKTVLGIMHHREWQGILGANQYYRYAQRDVTTDSAGRFPYSALSAGAADSLERLYRILAVSEGSPDPARLFEWGDAGSHVQVIPPYAGLELVVSVNWIPARVDQLSGDNVTVDFPDGHESILWLEAAGECLAKGGSELESTGALKQLAQLQREALYNEVGRRSAAPTQLAFPDNPSEWAGSY